MRGQKGLPPLVRGAVEANAGGQLLTNLRQASVNLGLRRFGGLRVFLANLLLDERAADQLVEGALPAEDAEAALAGVQYRQPHLILHVAGQDGLVADHGCHAVERHAAGRLICLGRILNHLSRILNRLD